MLFRRIFYIHHRHISNTSLLFQSSKSFTHLEFLTFSRYITTVNSPSTMADWKSEKEKFLNMDIKEKRKVYKSKNYVTAEEIPAWREYYKANEDRLVKLLNESKVRDESDTIYPYFAQGCDQVALWKGDITSLEIDAIVNAANSRLLGGGGVDGAIHRAAGSYLKQECATLGGCPTGDAKITGGYLLPAKYVIHTVGPQGEKPDLLKSCYNKSLNVLSENNLSVIAFPCVSTGIYGYPADKAAHVVLKTVRTYLENNGSIRKVIFTCFLDEDIKIYETLLQLYFPLE